MRGEVLKSSWIKQTTKKLIERFVLEETKQQLALKTFHSFGFYIVPIFAVQSAISRQNAETHSHPDQRQISGPNSARENCSENPGRGQGRLTADCGAFHRCGWEGDRDSPVVGNARSYRVFFLFTLEIFRVKQNQFSSRNRGLSSRKWCGQSAFLLIRMFDNAVDRLIRSSKLFQEKLMPLTEHVKH